MRFVLDICKICTSHSNNFYKLDLLNDLVPYACVAKTFNVVTLKKYRLNKYT